MSSIASAYYALQAPMAKYGNLSKKHNIYTVVQTKSKTLFYEPIRNRPSSDGSTRLSDTAPSTRMKRIGLCNRITNRDHHPQVECNL